jgi:hypothetical protein
VVGDGQVVGVARDRLPDERRAPFPLAEQGEEPADRLEVDERVRVERERRVGLDESRGGLALDEQPEGQGRARPLARRVEAHGVLGEGEALPDRGLGRRDLERMVDDVEPGELDPGERTLGLRGHGASQRLESGDEVRRLARQEEVVRAEKRPVRRPLLPLPEERLGHDPLLRGDPGGHDPRHFPREVAAASRIVPVLLGPDLSARPAVPEMHGHPRVAVLLEEVAGELEAPPFARRGREAAQVVAQRDAHVPVPVQLDRQVVHEPRRSLVRPALTVASGPHAEDDRGPAARTLHGVHAARPRFRRFGGSRPSEDRDVAASPQLKAHGVGGSLEEVVPLERAPQAPRLDADDGVHRGVEVRPPAEDPRGDRRLGQAVRVAGQCLFDDETDERPGAGGGVEIAAREDALEAVEDLLDQGRGTGRRRPDLVHDREPS